VYREYYVNDAGRQMDILGVSVWLRSLEAAGVDVAFPSAGYRGDYIRDIAAAYPAELPAVSAAELLDGLPADSEPDLEADTADERAARKATREAYVEALVARAKELLGAAGFDALRQYSLESIRADIEDDLREFGVEYDNWFSEQGLEKAGRVDAALDILGERDVLYKRDGATWFPAIQFGDEKDRVVVRDNGVKTYFASDIAYHFDKRERGFDHLIDILGADHHGYVARVRAGLEAMGYAGEDLEVELVQFVTLYRSGKKMQMSTRSGEFDTLRKLRAEVGNDAARFYYVMRSNDQHLDFDLDVATSQSNDNPVYYIQYAHARVASVFGKLADRSLTWDRANAAATLGGLDSAQEKALMTALSRYPEIIELAAENRAPQHLVHYLRDLAADFHSWYNANKFIDDPDDVRDARLALASATRVVIANGLGILGVSAPEHM
jgi:arginyl-tRNA synthetase